MWSFYLNKNIIIQLKNTPNSRKQQLKEQDVAGHYIKKIKENFASFPTP